MINKVIWRIKRLAKHATGNLFPPKLDVACDHERFGTDYGGWNVISEQRDLHPPGKPRAHPTRC